MSDKIKKSVHKTIVDGITSKIEEAIAKNKGKMPYGCVTWEIADAKKLFPTVDITAMLEKKSLSDSRITLQKYNNKNKQHTKKRAILTLYFSWSPTMSSKVSQIGHPGMAKSSLPSSTQWRGKATAHCQRRRRSWAHSMKSGTAAAHHLPSWSTAQWTIKKSQKAEQVTP